MGSTSIIDNKAFIYGIVPWDTAATVMGGMLEPHGLYPERYLVKGVSER